MAEKALRPVMLLYKFDHELLSASHLPEASFGLRSALLDGQFQLSIDLKIVNFIKLKVPTRLLSIFRQLGNGGLQFTLYLKNGAG